MTNFNVGNLVTDRRGNLYRVEGYHPVPQMDGTPLVRLTEIHPITYRENSVGQFELPENVLTSRMPKPLHKTVANEAIKYQVPVSRDHNGYYYIRDRESGKVLFISIYPTAKSGLVMIRKYRNWKEKGA